MNPLDFRGPEFLAFYVAWSGAVLAILWVARSAWERRQPQTPPLRRWIVGSYPAESDAYAIALLRGGPSEAARAVLGRLVGEGYLLVDGRQLKLPQPPPANAARLDSIEEHVLRALSSGASAGLPAQSAEAQAVQAMQHLAAAMQADLEQQGLAPAGSVQQGYSLFRRLGVAALLGLGVMKIAVGVSRDRPVGFLILLTFAFTCVCLFVLKTPLQTFEGRQYLDWLKDSHRGLVQMIEQGRRSGQGELALAAGIYGLTILPSFAGLLTALRPPPSSSSSSGCSSSSCSGGGCGGGGCGGGGCGGCGG